MRSKARWHRLDARRKTREYHSLRRDYGRVFIGRNFTTSITRVNRRISAAVFFTLRDLKYPPKLRTLAYPPPVLEECCYCGGEITGKVYTCDICGEPVCWNHFMEEDDSCIACSDFTYDETDPEDCFGTI